MAEFPKIPSGVEKNKKAQQLSFNELFFLVHIMVTQQVNSTYMGACGF